MRALDRKADILNAPNTRRAIPWCRLRVEFAALEIDKEAGSVGRAKTKFHLQQIGGRRIDEPQNWTFPEHHIASETRDLPSCCANRNQMSMS